MIEPHEEPVTEFYYHVQALALVTLEETQLLSELSAMHYDWVCKKAGQVGGFIYGMKNQAFHADSKKTEIMLSSRELGTLLKILEILQSADKKHWRLGMHLQTTFKTMLDDLGAEWHRVNPKGVPSKE